MNMVIVLDHLINLPAEPDKKTKMRAQRMAYKALWAGEIERKPCRVCGTWNRLHMHHEDYSKPLDIVWLCQFHHQQRHVELNAIKRRELDRLVAELRPEDIAEAERIQSEKQTVLNTMKNKMLERIYGSKLAELLVTLSALAWIIGTGIMLNFMLC